MKNLIVTACNDKYEDFLYNDWYMSLKDNVNLENIDILVIDFGLSDSIVENLKKENILIKKASIEGNIVNVRFFELYDFLKNNNYNNVLSCDSGDIIFQKDISNLLNSKIESFMAVCEDINSPMDIVLNNDNISDDLKKDIKDILENKKMINAGVIFGNRESFISLLEFIINNIKDLNVWGLDQLLINYYLYKYGFKELDDEYNFIPTTHISSFDIKDGKIYKSNGELVSIVHNAGGKSFFRPLKNFGYKNNKIRLNKTLVKSLRFVYKIFNRNKGV
ncbi:hypothetical protein [Marinitoga litoralis]|uniref:hypothetical protein n=1 Tax=Marinitoga litoralis TaxID=570855 RepID=UPI00195F2567|nr:hypothetical protein [Marinitoga litoralis]MBM7558304.1 hypothetical protein [Marinitoga litoralis]